MARATCRHQNSCCWRGILSGYIRSRVGLMFRTRLRNCASRSATKRIAQTHARLESTSMPVGDSCFLDKLQPLFSQLSMVGFDVG
jgi:hypothetical protein